ncbi:hypothetical protein HanHA300_Chr13g0468771 [Helianthus annuus]|nr:hypothetical protein HanHA300_Chr13g0468771 [Helianthus annuus]KAJ0496502.1 hypothetical protein HanHA89_Chr13g0500561 [Helianthus annuus]KAJ0670077.1 hypothetical protein HanOQP8_Chr13g0469991 [Helianthus annuus]
MICQLIFCDFGRAKVLVFFLIYRFQYTNTIHHLVSIDYFLLFQFSLDSYLI